MDIEAIKARLGKATPGCKCEACRKIQHMSDCAVHNEPAYPNGVCDCGAEEKYLKVIKNHLGMAYYESDAEQDIEFLLIVLNAHKTELERITKRCEAAEADLTWLANKIPLKRAYPYECDICKKNCKPNGDTENCYEWRGPQEG